MQLQYSHAPGVALAPPSILHIATTIWPRDTIIHRVHHLDYGAVQFNPGIKGNARFSPIADRNGKPIPRSTAVPASPAPP